MLEGILDWAIKIEDDDLRKMIKFRLQLYSCLSGIFETTAMGIGITYV